MADGGGKGEGSRERAGREEAAMVEGVSEVGEGGKKLMVDEESSIV